MVKIVSKTNKEARELLFAPNAAHSRHSCSLGQHPMISGSIVSYIHQQFRLGAVTHCDII